MYTELNLETEQSELHAAMAAPEFYKQDQAEITKTASFVEEIAAERETLMERWEELESIA